MKTYWRAAIKRHDEKFYHIVYFSTEKNFHITELVDWLADQFNIDVCNCYVKHLNVLEYIANALTCPLATMNTFTSYPRGDRQLISRPGNVTKL